MRRGEREAGERGGEEEKGQEGKGVKKRGRWRRRRGDGWRAGRRIGSQAGSLYCTQMEADQHIQTSTSHSRQRDE